jgi:hypothetical protein
MWCSRPFIPIFVNCIIDFLSPICNSKLLGTTPVLSHALPLDHHLAGAASYVFRVGREMFVGRMTALPAEFSLRSPRIGHV